MKNYRSLSDHIPTLQTFAVLVIAMTFGWKLGGATVLCYLVEGALGLPFFSGTPEKGIGIGKYQKVREISCCHRHF